MADDPPLLSILDEAFERSGLPTYSTSNPTLGGDPWDVFIQSCLNHAGITVEKLQAPAEADDTGVVPMHISTQIVDELEMSECMLNKDKEKISFVQNMKMDGVLVKLNNANRWQVTVCEEIPQRGAVGPARPSRKREAADLFKKVFHTHNHYEIVVDGSATGDGSNLRTTVAAAQLITIIIAFRKDGNHTVLNADGLPEIGQRRVDMMFSNKHVVTTQVRRVPCSVCLFCCLPPDVWNATPTAVGILRRGLRARGPAQLRKVGGAVEAHRGGAQPAAPHRCRSGGNLSLRPDEGRGEARRLGQSLCSSL